MNKKFFCKIMLMCIFIVFIFTVKSYATSDYTYELDTNNNATITSYKGSDTAIIIPSIIDGYNVIKIGDHAFDESRNDTNGKILEHVKINDGITQIGEFAFVGCENLEDIILPESITSLGNQTFIGCTKLASINIPSKVTDFGYLGNMFQETGFIEFTIPENITSAGNNTFRLCKNLKEVFVYNRNIEYYYTTQDNQTNDLNPFDLCPTDLILYGYKGSTTEEYAKTHNLTFKDIESLPSDVIEVEEVELDTYELSLGVGESHTITARVFPEYATNKLVKWSTDKSNIATVDSNGKVVGIAEGVANITATSGNKSATCVVTVGKETVPEDTETTNFDNAVFSYSYTGFNMLKVVVDGVLLKENHRYYMYISKKQDENPTSSTEGVSALYKDSEGKVGVNFFDNESSKALEQVGKNYIYIIEKTSSNIEKIVLRAKEMQDMDLPQLGQRLDIWLYDSKKTMVSNTIKINPERNITYKIGKVSSKDILKSFKNDSSNIAFNNLLKYAKEVDYLKTGTITVDGLDYNIVNDVEIEEDGYYFVYMVADTINGKYNQLEDVAIYIENSDENGNALVHFDFNNIKIDDDENDTEVEDDTGDNVDSGVIEEEEPEKDDTVAPTDKLPYTGEKIIVVSMFIVFIILIGIFYKKYKYYKEIK